MSPKPWVDYPRASRVLVDPRTRHELGEDGATLALAHLWLARCQTCGLQLDPDRASSLVVCDFGRFVEASLHHERCVTPQWSDTMRLGLLQKKTYAYRPIVYQLTDPDDGTEHASTVVLMNPGVERVQLMRDQDGWRLRRRTHHGFAPFTQARIRYHNPTVRARATGFPANAGQSGMQMLIHGRPYWDFGLGSAEMRYTSEQKGLLIVTCKTANPAGLNERVRLAELMRDITLTNAADAVWATLAR